MNYASGLMLGMGLVQGIKGFLSGNSSMGNYAGMSMGRGRTNNMGTMFDFLGNNVNSIRKGKNFQDTSLFSNTKNFDLNADVPKQENFKLVSAIFGRRRYRALHISNQLKTLMEGEFSKLSYIKSIEINVVSGSILITFDENDEDKINALEKWMQERLFAPQVMSFKDEVKFNKMLYGSITNSVKNTVHHVSSIIIRETHGLFDIKSLFSIIFATLGFRKIILNGESPSGVQMLWWAVSLMRGIKGV